MLPDVSCLVNKDFQDGIQRTFWGKQRLCNHFTHLKTSYDTTKTHIS